MPHEIVNPHPLSLLYRHSKCRHAITRNPAGVIQFNALLNPGLHFTEGAASRFRLVAVVSPLDSAGAASILASGDLAVDRTTTVPFAAPPGCERLELEARTFYCDNQNNVCRANNVVFTIPVAAGAPKELELLHRINATE